MLDTLSRDLQEHIALSVDDSTTAGRLARTSHALKQLLHKRLCKLREERLCKLLDKRVEISLAEKFAVEQKWQALAQTGVKIDVIYFAQNQASCRIQLVYAHGQKAGTEFEFQTHDACSTHWDREFCVSNAHNKKEAKLLAKIYVIKNIATMRLAGFPRCLHLREIVG